MSRIVIDAREYTTSTGRYMYQLLHYLQKLKSEHQYLVLLKPADMEVANLDDPRFTTVVCPHKEFTLDEQLGLLRQIKGLKPDLVHFGKDHQPVLYRGRVVTTMHDLTTLRFDNPSKDRLAFKFKQLVYRWVVKRVARKSDAILTGSEFVKDDLVQFTRVNPDKIKVVYEAADSIADKPEPLISLHDKQFLLYVGRPMPHKNLERLIEAFVQLKSQHPDLLLVLAGKKDANYQRIENETRARTIKNLHFTGHVSEGQLRWLYEHCSAYVFPSLSEGFGLPGLEAMVHGAPVVSSNATCLPEIYGEAAHYFDPLNIKAMADAINEVLTDKKLRTELIERGHEQVKKYSWQHVAERTLAVYEQVLGA
jgi:glycosyltransferase involved in cell wall biosynthesis